MSATNKQRFVDSTFLPHYHHHEQLLHPFHLHDTSNRHQNEDNYRGSRRIALDPQVRSFFMFILYHFTYCTSQRGLFTENLRERNKNANERSPSSSHQNDDDDRGRGAMHPSTLYFFFVFL
jgi:hypothetical protein